MSRYYKYIDKFENENKSINYNNTSNENLSNLNVKEDKYKSYNFNMPDTANSLNNISRINTLNNKQNKQSSSLLRNSINNKNNKASKPLSEEDEENIKKNNKIHYKPNKDNNNLSGKLINQPKTTITLQINNLIGKGGFAEVYSSYYQKLALAIKQLNLHFIDCEKEYELIKKIKHKNLPLLLGVALSNNNINESTIVEFDSFYLSRADFSYSLIKLINSAKINKEKDDSSSDYFGKKESSMNSQSVSTSILCRNRFTNLIMQLIEGEALDKVNNMSKSLSFRSAYNSYNNKNNPDIYKLSNNNDNNACNYNNKSNNISNLNSFIHDQDTANNNNPTFISRFSNLNLKNIITKTNTDSVSKSVNKVNNYLSNNYNNNKNNRNNKDATVTSFYQHLHLQKSKLIVDLSSLINYIHQFDIIHRDLKPGNLMLEYKTNRLKLLDFGISRTAETTVTSSKPRVGTIQYLSPEYCPSSDSEMKVKINKKSDIWALGLIISEMFSGMKPWAEKNYSNPIQILGFLYNRKKFLIPDCIKDDNIRCLIEKCTEYDIGKRFSSDEVDYFCKEVLICGLMDMRCECCYGTSLSKDNYKGYCSFSDDLSTSNEKSNDMSDNCNKDYFCCCSRNEIESNHFLIINKNIISNKKAICKKLNWSYSSLLRNDLISLLEEANNKTDTDNNNTTSNEYINKTLTNNKKSNYKKIRILCLLKDIQQYLFDYKAKLIKNDNKRNPLITYKTTVVNSGDANSSKNTIERLNLKELNTKIVKLNTTKIIPILVNGNFNVKSSFTASTRSNTINSNNIDCLNRISSVDINKNIYSDNLSNLSSNSKNTNHISTNHANLRGNNKSISLIDKCLMDINSSTVYYYEERKSSSLFLFCFMYREKKLNVVEVSTDSISSSNNSRISNNTTNSISINDSNNPHTINVNENNFLNKSEVFKQLQKFNKLYNIDISNIDNIYFYRSNSTYISKLNNDSNSNNTIYTNYTNNSSTNNIKNRKISFLILSNSNTEISFSYVDLADTYSKITAKTLINLKEFIITDINSSSCNNKRISKYHDNNFSLLSFHINSISNNIIILVVFNDKYYIISLIVEHCNNQNSIVVVKKEVIYLSQLLEANNQGKYNDIKIDNSDLVDVLDTTIDNTAIITFCTISYTENNNIKLKQIIITDNKNKENSSTRVGIISIRDSNKIIEENNIAIIHSIKYINNSSITSNNYNYICLVCSTLHTQNNKKLLIFKILNKQKEKEPATLLLSKYINITGDISQIILKSYSSRNLDYLIIQYPQNKVDFINLDYLHNNDSDNICSLTKTGKPITSFDLVSNTNPNSYDTESDYQKDNADIFALFSNKTGSVTIYK